MKKGTPGYYLSYSDSIMVTELGGWGVKFIEIFRKKKIMKADSTTRVKFIFIHSMQYSSVQHTQSNINEWNDGTN